MLPPTPHALPLGESQPPHERHAVSVSLPTWDSVIAWAKRDKWTVQKMRSGYPRFFIHGIIQKLSRDVLLRLQISDEETSCLILPSEGGATRCVAALKASNPVSSPLEMIRFASPHASASEEISWVTFYAILYSTALSREALAFWRDTGDGISSRHAEYCHARLDYLESDSTNGTFRTLPPKPIITGAGKLLTPLNSSVAEKHMMTTLIARLATSEQPGQLAVGSQDVFLYPTGIWLYAETIKVIKRSTWGSFVFYGRGTVQELDELERTLAAGKRIQALFCELPGNPQLVSPDLHRVRALAEKYDFIVACDETVGTFVNTDLLPYVDILMTSLTKMFSGVSDVMGGSVVVNPQSRHYGTMKARLASLHEETYFPLDIATIARNCVDFVPRVQRCNRNTIPVVKLISAHPLVAQVYYPSIGSTAPLYERYRRSEGGYGNLLSIIFREPRSAARFYDALDVCKGTSFGTNFTLAIPYVQLAHYHDQDWAESYGVPKHIVRLSVGLEDEDQILKTVARSLGEVEKFDGD